MHEELAYIVALGVVMALGLLFPGLRINPQRLVTQLANGHGKGTPPAPGGGNGQTLAFTSEMLRLADAREREHLNLLYALLRSDVGDVKQEIENLRMFMQAVDMKVDRYHEDFMEHQRKYHPEVKAG